MATPHRKNPNDRLFLLCRSRTILAERLSQALGENLVCIVGTARIHRPRFCVIHAGFTELTTQMSGMVRDIVPLFDECVNLLWRPRLSAFEDSTELSH